MCATQYASTQLFIAAGAVEVDTDRLHGGSTAIVVCNQYIQLRWAFKRDGSCYDRQRQSLSNRGNGGSIIIAHIMH